MIITTNVYLAPDEDAETAFVNFVITADNAAGPWSEPHVINGAPGIDPDLFFDDDGRIWYVGTHSPENPAFPGEGEIWLQELDGNNWSLKGFSSRSSAPSCIARTAVGTSACPEMMITGISAPMALRFC